MQPLNKEQRSKAFFTFLLLFVLTTGIIVTVIFFSIQVPFKQNNLLANQMTEVQKEKEFSQSFFVQMSDINGMLDTINTKSSRPELLDGNITEAIKDLNSKANSDSTGNKNLYTNVVQILADLQSTKKQLRTTAGNNDNVEELKRTINDLSTKLNQSLYREASLTQQIINFNQGK